MWSYGCLITRGANGRYKLLTDKAIKNHKKIMRCMRFFATLRMTRQGGLLRFYSLCNDPQNTALATAKKKVIKAKLAFITFVLLYNYSFSKKRLVNFTVKGHIAVLLRLTNGSFNLV